MPIIDDISYDRPVPDRRVIFRFPVYRKDALKHGGSVKILGIVKRMFSSGNVVRPRKNNSGWTEAVNNQTLSNNVPIFRIGELPRNATLALKNHDFANYHNTTQQHHGHGHGHHQHNHHHPHHHDHHHKTIQRRIIDEIENYCDKTTLHGLRYVGDPKLSFGERFFWFMSFAMAIGFAGYYISNVYEKWSKTPVIISFSPRDASLTDIPFPAITICNMNQAKRDEAEKIMDSGSNVEKRLLNDYCKIDNPINASSDDPPPNWETVKGFLFKVGQGCADTLRVCEWRLDPISCLDHFNNDLTDEGLCCSFNRLPPDRIYRKPAEIGLLNATYTARVYDWNPEKGFAGVSTDDIGIIPRRPIGAGAHLGLTIVLDTQVDNYFCSSTSSVGFKIILSNPIEAPKVADFGFLISPGVEARYGLIPTIREATEALRSIDISKRQCYFSNERPLQYFSWTCNCLSACFDLTYEKVNSYSKLTTTLEFRRKEMENISADYYGTYTERNCKLECQSNYTLSQCGCIPYFLPGDRTVSKCGKSQDHCVRDAKENMELTTGNGSSCYCLQGCFEMSFSKLASYSTLAANASVYRFNISVSTEYFQKNMIILHFYFQDSKFTRLIKSDLYGFTDFLSNTGGLLGLCLGFSFLSFVELVYFITIKTLCGIVKSRHHGDEQTVHQSSKLPFTK